MSIDLINYCLKCRNTKPLSEFPSFKGNICKSCKNSRRPTKIRNRCKCDGAEKDSNGKCKGCRRLYYENNKTKIIARVDARDRNMEKPDKETIRVMAAMRKLNCVYCGNLGGTIDHVIPVGPKHKGANHWTNMAPCCQKCNDSKGERTPEEWTNRWYQRKQHPE